MTTPVDITVSLSPTVSRSQVGAIGNVQGDGTAAGTLQDDGTRAGVLSDDGTEAAATIISRGP